MKKHAALFVALLLCLSLLLSGCAQEAPRPVAQTPVAIEAYKQAYEQLVTTALPGNTVTWQTNTTETETVHIAMINEQITSVMLLADADNVNIAQLALMLAGNLDETTITAFLNLAAISSAALLVDADTDADAALTAATGELSNVFDQLQQGKTPDNILGLPGGINITATGEGDTVQYFFALQLNAPAE